ncbi:hypothetical protein ONZ45_g12990 [Pleurotus djamor]|nr:hypothetical protein ONZ45_g12990 [Pleurotus djamor]
MTFFFADVANDNHLYDIIAFRCAKLPIRLYDTTLNCFVTRRQLQRVVEAQVIAFLRTRSRFEQIYEAAYDIKQKTIDCTKIAILSHTWGDDELTYQCIRENPHRLLLDSKFLGLCSTAKTYRCRYVWIDTICIDKSSSAELEESIRSMYTWYKMAHVCIVYLDEFDTIHHRKDRWFQRGWTLQELLAPRRMVFYGQSWMCLFSPTLVSPQLEPDCEPGFDILRRVERDEDEDAFDIDIEQYSQHKGEVNLSAVHSLLELTGISMDDLMSYVPSPERIRTICSYMHRRSTTIPEDAAYCLIGLLGIILPTAYGEGKPHALHRLQLACAELTNDRNIFLGDYSHGCSPFNSMLPLNPFKPHPYHFLGLSAHFKISVNGLWDHVSGSDRPDHTFTFTNGGLRISLILHDIFHVYEPPGALQPYAHKVYCACSPDHLIQTEYPPRHQYLSDGKEHFKLAILGVYSGPEMGSPTYAYAVILRKIDSQSSIQTYRRTPITVFPKSLPPTDILLLNPPTTVYIV